MLTRGSSFFADHVQLVTMSIKAERNSALSKSVRCTRTARAHVMAHGPAPVKTPSTRVTRARNVTWTAQFTILIPGSTWNEAAGCIHVSVTATAPQDVLA